MQAIYGDHCVDVSTLRRWLRRFKNAELGQADLSDKTRSGRPMTASDQLHQDRVEELIRGNHRIKQKEIAIELGISKERSGHIIGVLGFHKVCARWVPCMLSNEMIAERLCISWEPLERFEKEGEDFLTLQRGVMSTARHSENATCHGVMSTARHAALSHSFDYISTTKGHNLIGLLCKC